MARLTLALCSLSMVLCGIAFAAEPLSLWLDVPFVQQEKNGCGPASISMVMQYWQKRPGTVIKSLPDESEIARTLGADDRHGVRASAMARYFEQNGYTEFAFAGEWQDLEREITKGRPVIAALKPDAGNSLHYVVVAGVDDNERVVLLNDPARRKLLKEDRDQFEKEWKVTGNWTLLAVPLQASARH